MSVLRLDRLTKYYPAAAAAAVDRLSLTVDKGELLTLLGESGSGKTTTLRLICGFETPSSGSIAINSRLVAGNGVFLVPEQRNVRVVFQESTLFPHLTVEKNVAFGVVRASAQARKDRVGESFRVAGLKGLADRFPHELSGGQKQRVELARALASDPALLLLDEPFSNLDRILKTEMREQVSRILRETRTTAIFVTHDIEDAMTASNRVAILRRGRLQQLGSPQELYRNPANAYVASFLGPANILSSVPGPGGLETEAGWIDFPGRPDQACTISLRPEDFEVVAEDGEGILKCRVERSIFMGPVQELLVQSGSTTLRLRLPAEQPVKAGETVYARPRSERIWVLKS